MTPFSLQVHPISDQIVFVSNAWNIPFCLFSYLSKVVLTKPLYFFPQLSLGF